MKKIIDCLLIGHNEIDTKKTIDLNRFAGTDTEAFRDLNLAYINIAGRPCTLLETFNYFNDSSGFPDVTMGETFSAAITTIGSYLHSHQLSFAYVNDYNAEKQQLEELLANSIQTVAIITTLYVSVNPIIEVIEMVRRCNKDAKIILGGPFVSTTVKDKTNEDLHSILSYINADYYINNSKGEQTLVQLIRALKNKDEAGIAEIKNLMFFNKENNGLVITGHMSENITLEENPINYELFRSTMPPYLNIRTAVSCPYTCSFCGFPERAGKYQTLDVELVEKELDKVKELGCIRDIYFIDDTFNVPKDRFKKLMQMLIRKKYDFKWHSYYRCQFADEETMALMKEAGCEGVFLGIESGSDKILKNMAKGATIDKYRRGIEILRKHDIATFGSFIVGFPGETEETVKETVDFIETSGLEMYRTQLWFYEHITPIAKEKNKYAIEGEGFVWKHATMDSKTATAHVENIFATVKNSLWIPQYGFDFDSLWHLVHRDVRLKKVKQFIAIFNDCLKDKLYKPDLNIDAAKIKLFRDLMTSNNNPALTANATGALDIDFTF